jgi:ferrous iron transport protein B
MSSCCDTKPDPADSSLKDSLTIALAGNPNSGKTTIFNALTGLRQKVANYPGVTVEKKTGKFKLPDGRRASAIDLPGTYSLISRSPDEQVAMEVLRGLRADTPAPDLVIVVVDASNLQRNLYLVSQLIELGRPLVVALNMMDIAQRRGIDVSPQLLQKELGVPVVPVIGHKREGIKELKAAIGEARVAPLPDFPLPDPFKEELLAVGTGLAKVDALAVGKTFLSAQKQTSRALGDSVPPRSWICNDDSIRHLDRYQALAERLLIGDNAPDLDSIVGHEHVRPLLASSRNRLSSLGIEPMQADIEAHYRWIESVAGRVISSAEELAAMGNPAPGGVLEYESAKRRTLTEHLDSVLIHRVWGLAIFAVIMAGLFVTIFWLADPIMGGIKAGVAWLGEVAVKNRFWEMKDGPVKALLTDGIFAGVGAVVVFVPQIAILFFFLAILEDSGYLARAAFLMDRLLAKVGLHGKSFIPLLSSFACAIPGIMATRTIEDRKSRLATIMIAPFMSCSARLPVYTLLIGAFFAGTGAFGKAGIMLSLYALGIVAAAGTAWCFKRTLLKGPTPAFILELPTYKLPQPTQIARHVFTNTWSFLAKAGTIIFCLSVILWAMAYYPRLPQAQADLARLTALQNYSPARLDGTLPDQWQAKVDKSIAGEQIRQSVAGRIGHFLEPAIKPLGYDWKMGVGLVGAFAAREVFVSTMGIIYSVGDVEDDRTTDLESAMRNDHYSDGRPVWTTPVALSLLVWFVLAMQCMSTIAIVRRETGGWRWPLFMLAYMNALAYVAALGTYQMARLLVS